MKKGTLGHALIVSLLLPKLMDNAALDSRAQRAPWQLLLEGPCLLQTQDLWGVSLTTPVAEVATDSTAQLVGTFRPGTGQPPG